MLFATRIQLYMYKNSWDLYNIRMKESDILLLDYEGLQLDAILLRIVHVTEQYHMQIQ